MLEKHFFQRNLKPYRSAPVDNFGTTLKLAKEQMELIFRAVQVIIDIP